MVDVRSFRSRPGAAFAASLWLLGTVVLPALHLARHARPHDHEGGGVHYHLDEEAGHGHDDGHDDDGDEPGGPLTVEAPHGDGHGHSHHADGLAHFAAATGEGAVFAVEVACTNTSNRVPDALAIRNAVFFLKGKKAARAPPAA